MVFQNILLFDDTVYANVAYPLRIRGMTNEEVKSRVHLALQTVGMEDFAGRWAKSLSGGETQRVADSRVLTYQPELLLLDELTANLDPANTMKIEQIIKEVREVFGTTIIIATHNIFQAKRLGDRIALLLNGIFIEIADSESFFNKPQQDLTRAFLSGEFVY